MKTLILIVVFAIAISSCGSFVNHPIGTSRFAEIEGGEIGFSLGAGNAPNRVIFLAQDSEKGDDTITSTRTSSEYIRSTSTTLTLGITLFDRFAVFNGNGLSGVQWQVIGDTVKAAANGNFAVSLLYGAGSGSFYSPNTELANKDRQLVGQTDLTTNVLAVLVSYRLKDNLGISIDGFGQQFKVTGSGVIRDLDGNTLLSSATLTENTTDMGIAIGIFAIEDQLKAGFKYSVIQANDPITSDSNIIGALGAGIEYTF